MESKLLIQYGKYIMSTKKFSFKLEFDNLS